jgi:hypothetical protein
VPCIQKKKSFYTYLHHLLYTINKKKKDVCTVVSLFVLSRNCYYIQKHYSSIKVEGYSAVFCPELSLDNTCVAAGLHFRFTSGFFVPLWVLPVSVSCSSVLFAVKARHCFIVSWVVSCCTVLFHTIVVNLCFISYKNGGRHH